MENANENKKEIKNSNKILKITKIVMNVIFYSFIVILLLFSISNLGLKDDQDIPGLFGNGFLTVQTNSMAGEEDDSFTAKDLIFVKVVTEKNRAKLLSKLEVGDIITFSYFNKELDGIILNTHRIVDIVGEGENTLFITQGDKVGMNPVYDYVIGGENDADYYESVGYENVKAIYKSKWSGVGATMKFIQSSTGFLVCIVLPTLIFFVVQAILLVLNFTKIKHNKDVAKLAIDNEELLKLEREKIKQELLAEMEKNKESEQK